MYKRWVIHLTGESCIIFRNWLALERAVSPGSITPRKSKHQKHRINTNTWSFLCPTHNAYIHTLSYIQFLKTLESKYYHYHVYFIDGNLRFQDQRNLVCITQLISGGMGTSPPLPPQPSHGAHTLNHNTAESIQRIQEISLMTLIFT